jgi:hypothetical protein
VAEMRVRGSMVDVVDIVAELCGWIWSSWLGILLRV